MAIGERIRYIRNLRGITQKALGMAVGFPEKTAEIRMAQYESGSRTPKKKLVEEIAYYLGVEPYALEVPNFDHYYGLLHSLFALEDLTGCTVKKDFNNDEVHLVFNFHKCSESKFNIYDDLSKLAEQSEKYQNSEISRNEYDNWRYNYPSYVSLKKSDQQISDEINQRWMQLKQSK